MFAVTLKSIFWIGRPLSQQFGLGKSMVGWPVALRAPKIFYIFNQEALILLEMACGLSVVHVIYIKNVAFSTCMSCILMHIIPCKWHLEFLLGPMHILHINEYYYIYYAYICILVHIYYIALRCIMHISAYFFAYIYILSAYSWIYALHIPAREKI